MIAKWIVDGGYIRSQRDGQRHYVSAAQVARLHRLGGRQWVRRIGDEEPHLFPRRDGEYRDLRNTPVPPARPDR